MKKEQLFTDKNTFRNFLKQLKEQKEAITEPDIDKDSIQDKPYEEQFLHYLHKLDDKNLKHLEEETLDDYIEKILFG